MLNRRYRLGVRVRTRKGCLVGDDSGVTMLGWLSWLVDMHGRFAACLLYFLLLG